MNKVILMGNIGGELELRQAGETSVTSFSLATRRGKDQTDWHNIVLWGKSAEIACEYLRKGSQIAVEGEIRNESYEKDGETKYITKIHCYKFHFTSGGQKQETTPPEKEKEKENNSEDLPF